MHNVYIYRLFRIRTCTYFTPFFYISEMSLTSSFAAGSAGGFVVIVTAVVSSQAYSRLTAQGKVEALERLHQLVRERHQHFVDKMLIRLQPTHSDNVQFQGSQVITDLLDRSDGSFYLMVWWSWSDLHS